ncbi:MAG: methyltransferase domain-containing protein [Planctomycetota bacterium]
MSRCLVEPESATTVNPSPNILKRFLETYWLRPENALWMTLRSLALSRCRLDRPFIDLCCGDGLFSFLHLGGVLDPDFDVFLDVADIDPIAPARIDMFDQFTNSYRPQITGPPRDTIDVGTDLKPNLLAKAARLSLYGRLIRHNGNDSLPLADSTFKTLYCNAAYWVNDIDRFLGELRRILQPSGLAILQVKLDCIRRYNFDRHANLLGERFLKIIAGDRVTSWPTLASRTEWERRFQEAGLLIQNVTPVVTQTHAYLWDVGLRPIAPLLVRMANALSAETRSAIKRDWVALLLELASPFCNPSLNLSSNPDDPPELQYVLSRS